MKELNNFINIRENQETLLTIYISNKKILDVIPIFEKELEKAKNINNTSKKHKICNRYYQFIKKLNDFNEETIIHSIFLINDEIFEYKLNKEEIEIIKTYNLKEIYFEMDEYFHISYLIDLFTNFEFIYTILLSKNNGKTIIINKNKNKIIDEIKINNENELQDLIDTYKNEYQYKNTFIIYGESNLLDKLENNKNYIICKGKYSYSDIYLIYQDKIDKENLELLEKKLNDLNNEKTNLDLYVFGRLKIEIKESIETYSIKELYIEKRKIDLLKNFIDNEYFNFKIIPIKSLKEGDIGDIFIKNYKGLMGIKYY
jgi:hypothetical protein